jgi:hypothetical protein
MSSRVRWPLGKKGCMHAGESDAIIFQAMWGCGSITAADTSFHKKNDEAPKFGKNVLQRNAKNESLGS